MNVFFFFWQVSFDSVTGDQVSKKGGMTGGFYDHRRSKLKFMNMIMQNTKAINIKEDDLAKVRSALQDILFVVSSTVTHVGINDFKFHGSGSIWLSPNNIVKNGLNSMDFIGCFNETLPSILEIHTHWHEQQSLIFMHSIFLKDIVQNILFIYPENMFLIIKTWQSDSSLCVLCYTTFLGKDMSSFT